MELVKFDPQKCNNCSTAVCMLPAEDLLLLFMEKIQEPSLENLKKGERDSHNSPPAATNESLEGCQANTSSVFI